MVHTVRILHSAMQLVPKQMVYGALQHEGDGPLRRQALRGLGSFQRRAGGRHQANQARNQELPQVPSQDEFGHRSHTLAAAAAAAGNLSDILPFTLPGTDTVIG